MPSVCSISFFIFQSRGIEPVKIVAENLYSNLGLAAGEHGVDTVGNRLPYLDIHSGELTQFLTQLVGDFTPCPAMVREYGTSSSGRLRPRSARQEFGSARLAGHPLTSGTDMMMRSASRPTASLWSSDIPGSALRLMVNDPSLNAGRKLRPSVKNSATLTAKSPPVLQRITFGWASAERKCAHRRHRVYAPARAGGRAPAPFTGTQKMAAKHRCHRQRHDRRGYQRHNEGDAERHKHPPLDSGEGRREAGNSP